MAGLPIAVVVVPGCDACCVAASRSEELMNPDHYTLEMWADDAGTAPVEQFLDGLTEPKRSAVEAALTLVLAQRGTDVCSSEWGKPLGKGLYEFRVRHELHEILGAVRPDLVDKWTTDPTTVLVRVFFYAHGNRLILLLGGYDKGVNPKKKQQDAQIATARARLKAYQRQHPEPKSFLDRWKKRRKGGAVKFSPLTVLWDTSHTDVLPRR
jgi:hypothetical protein